MQLRFLAGAVGAVGLLAATCATAAPNRRSAPPAAPVAASPFSNFFAMFSAVPRTTVEFPGNHKPGTIIISTQQRRLYLVLGNGQALRYGIGVGRDGFTWGGRTTITDKREWPDWTPPEQMLKRRPDLPHHMAGGTHKTLWAPAMYRIHGSNEPHTIGTAASSGCIRLTNDDVIDLYNRVKVGTTVIVQQ